MNLGQLNEEVRMIISNPVIESSINGWINDVLLQLAYQFDFATLRLHTPAILTTTETDWLYPLTEAVHPDGYLYMKKVVKASTETVPQGFRLTEGWGEIDDIDPEHTATGASIERIAIEGDEVGIYPMASDSLRLWFYRPPPVLTLLTDAPDWMPAAFHSSVICSHVVLRCFRVFPDLALDQAEDSTRALALWSGRVKEALYGDGFHIGLVDALVKNRKARVRGPHAGANLSGSDAWRPW